jgi:GntR family transcriptional regulator of gluconate operon
MQLDGIRQLERRNLAAEVAAQLRGSIASGALPPGTRLIETELADKLGVSRGPLREALRVLEAEGLVQSQPGKGASVAEISEKDIQELYSLRLVLESEALRLAIQNADASDLEILEGRLGALMDAAESGDHAAVLDCDLEFHRQIWRLSNHGRLESYLREIAMQVKMYIAVQTSLYDDLVAGISDHRLLLQAIQEQDEAEGLRILQQHFRVAAEALLDFQREKDLGAQDVEAVNV